MGLVLGVNGATDATGWTSYTGSPPTIYYVSKGAGASDSNTGLAGTFTSGTNGPFLTLLKGQAAMAALTNGTEAWLLLRQGDTWTNENLDQIEKAGASATQPIIYSSYDEATPMVFNPGTGARPLIKTAFNQTGIYVLGNRPNGGQNVAIIGLEFYSHTRDPASLTYDPTTLTSTVVGMGMTNPNSTFCLIEDCKLSFYSEAISPGPPQYPDISSGQTIRRNVIVDSYTLLQIGNGIHCQSINAPTIEENFIDHNGWLDNTTIYFVCSSANATSGATYTNNGVTFTVVTTIAAGTLLRCTKALNVWPSVSGTLVKASGTGDANITYSFMSVTTPDLYSFCHNIYVSGYTVEYNTASIPTPIALRGNIISRDASGCQLRTGGTIYNNLWIQNPYTGSLAFPNAGTSVISFNVVTEAASHAAATGGNFEDGLQTGQYSAQYDYGTFDISNNILTHTTRGGVGGNGISTVSGYNGSIASNILFDWLAPLLDVGTGGLKTYGAITAGTGATAYPTFTATIDDGAGSSGRILTVTSITGTPLTLGLQITGTGVPNTTFINAMGPGGGLTGTGGTGTYGIFIAPDALTGALVASTTMTLNNWHLPLTSITGSGSGAHADIQISSGAVTNVSAHLTGQYAINTIAIPGSGYAVGDRVTASVPGSTGFEVLVASVSTVTQSGNQQDASGTNDNPGGLAPLEPFPHPERTIGSYMTLLGLGSTTADFFAAARLQSKTNWNPALTANAVNNYFRVGFGLSEIGVAAHHPNRRHKHVAFQM
jgi:hypothetical protein